MNLFFHPKTLSRLFTRLIDLRFKTLVATPKNVIILGNTSADGTDSKLLEILLRNSSELICVDDGLRTLLKFISIHPDFNKSFKVVGDFDSVLTDDLDLARSLNGTVIQNPCQECTDFHKALKILNRAGDLNDVIVWSSIGPRLDHAMLFNQAEH